MLIKLTSRSEVTQELFWDRPCNSEPRSEHEDDTELSPLSPSFHTTPAGGRLSPPTYDLACGRSAYTVDLQWKQVSSLVPSGPEDETLPLGHRGFHHLK
ncbi:hypothetical protein AVEN_128192-1 [Araneus ventricosus]|uniref:Uncharacterized protein n=1 Tax=Araneus ventricosus TaxID=182803 RepID=A0A4Y2A0E8_ARAVE|nr:hypothetical protein AVEN_128192-1 [Araneus ventricosus]